MGKGKYKVYEIRDTEGEVIYIGRTNDLKRREYQHNYHCFRRSKETDLYKHVRGSGMDKIELVEIWSGKTKVESKRYECMLILQDHFGERKLKQKVPSISDR